MLCKQVFSNIEDLGAQISLSLGVEFGDLGSGKLSGGEVFDVDIKRGLEFYEPVPEGNCAILNSINLCGGNCMSQREILFGELISSYAAGERDFSEVFVETPTPEDLSWQPGQFKGLDLSGIILRDSSIRWIAIYMDGVILRGADLTNVDLGESNFERADLSNAILRRTTFFQSVFDEANLSGADLTGAREG